MAEPDNWTVVASAIPKRRVSTAEILRMVADGWHLTPGTVAYQKSVDQLRARADELDAATVEAAEPVSLQLAGEELDRLRAERDEALALLRELAKYWNRLESAGKDWSEPTARDLKRRIRALVERVGPAGAHPAGTDKEN